MARCSGVLWGCAAALCVHAQALADGNCERPTSLAANGCKVEWQTFVQLFLVGFAANLIWQGVSALRRLRSDFEAVRR